VHNISLWYRAHLESELLQSVCLGAGSMRYRAECRSNSEPATESETESDHCLDAVSGTVCVPGTDSVYATEPALWSVSEGAPGL